MSANEKNLLVCNKKQSHSETARRRSSKKEPGFRSRSGVVESPAGVHLSAKTVIINAHSAVIKFQITLERGGVRSIETARGVEQIQAPKGQLRQRRKKGKPDKTRSSAFRRCKEILGSLGPTALLVIEVILKLLGLIR